MLLKELRKMIDNVQSFRIYCQLDDANRYNGRGEDMEAEYTATSYYSLELTIKTPTDRIKAETSIFV